ncbi:N-acetyltransferase 9-like protein isoform X1 [Dermacentor silvarum]|uniref:N-acetyltransferase 9-like protein isoform X1 n=1 Tax=Dermacentor silvarum TaxID=543639 RepID=UPI00189913F2|nr:N-acetyltransferase 9-like protein isoform X1 [Dermacentor silvarum]
MRINAKTQVWSHSVVLVPYREHHVAKYHEWMKDPYLQAMTASEPLTLEQEYEMQKSWLEDEDKCTFIILDRETYESSQDEVEAMIGDVNLFFNDQDRPRDAEIEVMIAESSQRRKGRGKESIHLMMRYGVQELHVMAFSAKIKLNNEVSQRLFENIGFTLVSTSSVFEEATYHIEVNDHLTTILQSATPHYRLESLL